MTSEFDPNAIRGDIESELTNVFYPSAHSAATSYVVGNRVRLGGVVYRANAPVIGVTPPSAEWDSEGPVYPIIYENVDGKLAPSGGIKVMISWTDTYDASIYCETGTLREVNGVLSTWILTPKNQGTAAALKASARLRSLYLRWARQGTCGQQVKISSVRGPSSSMPSSPTDHCVYVMTASLKAMERVVYVR